MIVPATVATAAVVAGAGADAAVVGGAAAAPGELLGLLLLSPQDARRRRPLPGQRGESAGQVPPEGAGGGGGGDAATRPRPRVRGGGGSAVHRFRSASQGKQADGASSAQTRSKTGVTEPDPPPLQPRYGTVQSYKLRKSMGGGSGLRLYRIFGSFRRVFMTHT